MKLMQSDVVRHLQERIANGESCYDILRIKDKYYCDKIIAGLVPISTIIFRRVMNDILTEDEAREIEESGNSDLVVWRI